MTQTFHFDRYITIRIEGEDVVIDYDSDTFGADLKSKLVQYTEWLIREWGLDLYDGASRTIPPEMVVEDFFGSVDDA